MLNDILTHANIASLIASEDLAREFIEFLRWPNGPVCPHCESVKVYSIAANSAKKVRKGLYKCGECKKQFTVTVGTIFEDSRIPLNKWFHAIHLLCSSKKGFSSHQIHRTLGITYKSAWFLTQRIRYAMAEEPMASQLTGVEQEALSYGPFSQQGTFDGVPVMVGGTKDQVSVHLEGRKSEKYVCQANRTLAREIAQHLFETIIRVKGVGRWIRHPEGRWEMRSFKIEHFDPLGNPEEISLKKSIEELRAIPAKWKELDDPVGELKRIRYGPEV